MGTLRLPSRILMPAMHLNMAPGGQVNERLIDFYEERARADPGPGLIIVGGCYTEKRGAGTDSMISLAEDSCIPGLRTLTERVHRHGQAIAAQLYHAGRYAFSFLTGEHPVSASEVPSRFNPEVPHALSGEEIAAVEKGHAQAARRVREAGFDAVELIVCGGYLVNQFLSPLTNRRSDRYGGDLDSRMTFMREVIAAVRGAVGEDFPFICRLSGSDFVEKSHTLQDTKVVAAEMVRCGVDMISVTGGWHETRVPQITMNVPRGAFVYLAEGIREAVRGRVPVACCNRINDPALAQQILAEDRADIVGMARAFLADPLMLHKVREGRAEEVRKCIACNQGCFDHVFMLQPVSCLVNPRVNRERETEPVPTGSPRRVLVAGGGPAGVECALAASARGHRVTLCEASGTLGGQLQLASVPPGREEFAELLKGMERRLESSNVKVMLSTPVTAPLVRELEPEVLVLATGARELQPEIARTGEVDVCSAWEVLAGKARTGDRVLIVGGGAVGIETGLLLAERGKDVTVVEMQERLGVDIGASSRWTILQDAKRLGVKFVPGCCVEKITARGAVAAVGGEPVEMTADTVVTAVGVCSDERLASELEREGLADSLEIRRVGDCVQPRKAYEAIREGFQAGLEI